MAPINTFFDIKDFTDALSRDVPKFFSENAGTEKTGYYDLDCPVRIMRDEKKRPNPERTPDAKSFDAKYSLQSHREILRSAWF